VTEEQILSGVGAGDDGVVDDSENSADQDVGSKIVAGGIFRLAAFGVATALGVVSIAIISRVIGPSDFALFTTALSLITISSSVSDIGLLSLGIREFAALSGDARVRSQRALITLRFMFASVASLLIVLFAWLDNYPTGLLYGLIAAAIGLCGLSLHASYNVPIQATYQLKTMAILEVSRQTLVALGMAVAAIVTGEIGWIVAIYLPVGITMALASAYYARRITPTMPSWDWSAMVGLLRHVGTFAVAASIGAIYAYVAQVICNAILPAHESGLFALAFRVFAVLIGACMVAVSGAFALLVTAARTDPERMAYATRRLLQTAALTGVACTVGLVTGATFVVAVLGGSEFADAAPIVAVIGLALPASFVVFTGSSVLLAAGRHSELVLVSVIGATASVLATTILAKSFSTTGAAAGIVVGETVIATGYLIQIARMDTHALPRLNWSIAVLVAGAIACAAALLPLPGIVCGVLGLLIFAGLAILLKLVPPELLDRLKAIPSALG
jgi:O-antigen/teichoic acid export membrane protein